MFVRNLGFYSVWGARSRKPLILQCLGRPWARKPVFSGVSRALELLRAPGSSCGPDSVATRILGGETAPGPFRLVFYKVNGPRAIPTRILRGEAAPGPFRLLFNEKNSPGAAPSRNLQGETAKELHEKGVCVFSARVLRPKHDLDA